MCYRVVRVTPEYVPQVAELAVGFWGPDPVTNTAYYEWKYLSNPYLPDPLLYLALDGDQLVGMRGFMGARWEVDGRLIDAPIAGDLLVAEQHRNRGVFNLIMDFAMQDLRDQGYRFVFNLSGGSLLTRWSQLGLGWKGIGPLDIQGWSARTGMLLRLRELIWSNKPLRAVWSVMRPLVFQQAVHGRGVVQRFDFQRLDRHMGQTKCGIRLHCSPDPTGMAKVAKHLPHDGRIRHLRDAEYFAWRYRNPLIEYRFLLHGESRLVGYLALAGQRYRPDCEVVIADWEATSVECAQEMLATALRWGKFRDIQIWAATLSPEWKRLLSVAGFKNIEQPVSASHPRRDLFVGRVPGVDEWSINDRDVRDLSNWDLRMLFSDNY